jgi:glycerol-3-phosphate dehydrogenase (NAD(P)+)
VSRRVAVLGAGNWGVTLAHVIAENGSSVDLYARDVDQVVEINERRTSGRAVPGLVIGAGVRATVDLRAAVEGAELVVFVVPSQGFRSLARAAGEHLAPEQLVIHATKGLELGTHARMSTILAEETCVRQVGVLAGPNIAAEIARGRPAGTTVATRFPRVFDVGRAVLASPLLVVLRGTDVLGVELCSALKNVVAVAAGMASQMGLGENAKALLATRGMSDIARLSLRLGAERATFHGLAGIGDLIVTCASEKSRNHRLGAAIARGARLNEALAELGMVAEGVYASIAAHDLARSHGVDVPVLERVYRVLHEGLAPEKALAELLRLDVEPEPPDALRAGVTPPEERARSH